MKLVEGLLHLLGGLLLLLLLCSIFVFPWNRRTGHPEREKACYANMRVILGAVEMYNMDHSVPIDRVDSEVVKRLFAMGIIKSSPPSCPELRKPRIAVPFLQERLWTLSRNLHWNDLAWQYSPGGVYSGTDLASGGKIVCTEHGTVEE